MPRSIRRMWRRMPATRAVVPLLHLSRLAGGADWLCAAIAPPSARGGRLFDSPGGTPTPPPDQGGARLPPASGRGSAPPSKPGRDRQDKAGSLKGTPISLAAARAEAARKIPLDRAKYQTVRTLADLNGWIARAHEVGHVAIDAKANSIDPMQAEICGVALALGPN